MVLDRSDVIDFLKYLSTDIKKINLSYNTENFINSLPDYLSCHFISIETFILFVGMFKEVLIGYKTKASKINYCLEDVKTAYNYFKWDVEEKKSFLQNIKVRLYPKHKSGDTSNVKNYRFIQKHNEVQKIIDRCLLSIILTLCIKEFDNNVFISCMKENFTKSCVEHATINTLTKNKTVCLDIKDAFNSVNYHILYKSLQKLLCVNNTVNLSKIITDEYFLVILNRKCYYEDTHVPINIGVPQGLSSSNFMFSVIMWNILNDFNQTDYKLYLYLQIYVDDIYIKFHFYCSQNLYYLNKFIDLIEYYRLLLNVSKCCSDKQLGFEYKPILDNTFYLGICFTRDKTIYNTIILQDYNQKHNLSYTWYDLYSILIRGSSDNKKIIGYLNYKLKPVISNNTLINYIKLYCLTYCNLLSMIVSVMTHDHFLYLNKVI